MEKVYDTAMAKKIRVLLAEMDMSESQLARDVGVSQAAISSICRGRSSPRADTLTMICKRLKVSADYLLGLEDMQ